MSGAHVSITNLPAPRTVEEAVEQFRKTVNDSWRETGLEGEMHPSVMADLMTAFLSGVNAGIALGTMRLKDASREALNMSQQHVMKVAGGAAAAVPFPSVRPSSC